jgi:hypothetical protein
MGRGDVMMGGGVERKSGRDLLSIALERTGGAS